MGQTRWTLTLEFTLEFTPVECWTAFKVELALLLVLLLLLFEEEEDEDECEEDRAEDEVREEGVPPPRPPF